jgi:hypothetical protein
MQSVRAAIASAQGAELSGNSESVSVAAAMPAAALTTQIGGPAIRPDRPDTLAVRAAMQSGGALLVAAQHAMLAARRLTGPDSAATANGRATSAPDATAVRIGDAAMTGDGRATTIGRAAPTNDRATAGIGQKQPGPPLRRTRCSYDPAILRPRPTRSGAAAPPTRRPPTPSSQLALLLQLPALPRPASYRQVTAPPDCVAVPP